MYHCTSRRILLQILITLLIVTNLMGQESDPNGGLTVNIQPSPEFDAVNLENLITLTFSSQNEQPVLNFEIINNDGIGSASFLMNTHIRSENSGLILESRQNPESYFRIEAGDTLRFSNLDMIRGSLPGQSESIKFDFTLTNRGRNLLSNLYNGAIADDDQYLIDVQLVSVQNSDSDSDSDSDSGSDRSLASSSTALIESELPEFYTRISADPQALDALSQLNLDEEQPVFRWVAPSDLRYRLIVADNNDVSGDITETLNGRFSMDFDPELAFNPDGSIIMDIFVEGTEFVMPAVLAAILEPGSEYAWQVSAEVVTLRQKLNIKSEIWTFEVFKEDEVNEQLIALLSELLGEDKVDQMIEDGYELQQIELGGEVYNAGEAVEILREMLQKIRNRRATIGE